jgi:nicotinamidase-related amidase
MEFQPVRIDRMRDVLVLNDLQKDFLDSGIFTPEAKKEYLVKARAATTLFHLSYVYFFTHFHRLSLFKKDEADLRHCVMFDPIAFVEDGVPTRSFQGISIGAELEDTFQVFNYYQRRAGSGNLFRKFQCPLLGANFSIFQICELAKLLIEGGRVRRLFFAGLHFDDCVKNELDYLSGLGKFELFVLKDLIKSTDLVKEESLIKRMQAQGITFLQSSQLSR